MQGRVLGPALVALCLALAACQPSGGPKFKSTDVTGAEFGKSLELTGHDGRPRSLQDFRGRIVVLFFGFTHCPDICPLTLHTMTQALEAAGPAASKVQPVFISVDPARDTAEALTAYMTNFDPRFVALTGTPEQVKGAEQSYRVFSAKVPIRDAEGKDTGDYAVNHSGYIYLMDRDGKYLAHFQKDAAPQEIATRLQQLP